jgi:ATP-dependent helicase HrpB
MAQTLGEPVGETVGFRVRMQSKVSARTRIEVVTEGVFTRMILDDPGLEGVSAVLFDEFHERSLDADLGLALARDAQAVLRPDLRLLVMSATLTGRGGAEPARRAPRGSRARDAPSRRHRYVAAAIRRSDRGPVVRVIRRALGRRGGRPCSSSCRARGRSAAVEERLAEAVRDTFHDHRPALRRAGAGRAGPGRGAPRRRAAQGGPGHLDRETSLTIEACGW